MFSRWSNLTSLPRFATIVDPLAADRLKADDDHHTMQDWQDADARDAIDRAKTFVNEVHTWFRRHHRPEAS